MNEFDLIQTYFKDDLIQRPDVLLGVGDDAAITLPEKTKLCIATDTLVEKQHFFEGTSPEAIGHKALAVNLSDLAAMGARPAWALLALTLPSVDEAWLDAFAKGFYALAHQYNVALIGGDITKGPLSITVTVHGYADKPFQRSQAKVGDSIFVSRKLGDAREGLSLIEADRSYLHDMSNAYIKALLFPSPEIKIGLSLTNKAHACIDVSDGLVGDLYHLLDASQVGAIIHEEAIPHSTSVEKALKGGDDYALLFTAPEDEVAKLKHEGFFWIGTIDSSEGLRMQRQSGEIHAVKRQGFQHF